MPYEYTRTNDLWEAEITLVKHTVTMDENFVVQRGRDIHKEVFAMVGSIYAKEYFYATQSGISAQWKVVIYQADYDGETEVIYNGQKYAIYRTYPDGDYIELYLRNDLGTLDDN